MRRVLSKRILLALATMLLTLGLNTISYARDEAVYEAAKNMEVESVLLDPSVRSSTSDELIDSRSTALATAISEITNEGSGVIGVYAATTFHKGVEWACLTLYLEQWDEESQDWFTVKDYYEEFLPEEGKDLVLVTKQEFVDDPINCPPGYYYRVRALHELEFEDEDGDIWYEAKVTRTNGIMITSTP